MIRSKIEAAATQMLMAVGENTTREGLQKTPQRVALMYEELFAGYRIDAVELLESAIFEQDGIVEDDMYQQGMVVVRDIEYFSHCEHHMVPFFGRAHVAYIPRRYGVGLSKIARIVDVYARRFQVQERMTKQIAEAMVTALDPVGVMVVVTGTHLCMKMRGVKNASSDTVTTAIRGLFEQPAPRAEFLSYISSSLK